MKNRAKWNCILNERQSCEEEMQARHRAIRILIEFGCRRRPDRMHGNSRILLKFTLLWNIIILLMPTIKLTLNF
jgi:hypothetical protein